MATKKKAAKPAKKAVHVKKIAPARKAAARPAHSSGSGKTSKKAPAAKSIAKPAAKKIVPSSSAKRTTHVPARKTTVSNLSKPAVISKPAVSNSKTPVVVGKVQLAGKPTSTPSLSKAPIKTQPAVKAQPPLKAQTPVKTQLPAVFPPPPPTPAAVKPEPKKPTTPPKQVKVVIPEIKTKTVRKYEPEFTKSVLDTPQEEQTGPTMRYSDVELGEFRELINRKLDAAKKELAYLQGLITRKDEMGGDNDDARYMTMEDGSMSMEREQLSQMASRQITFIDHLEKALMRIENKTYGICRVTGKLIDKARLRAVPHATLSIEAKQMMNK